MNDCIDCGMKKYSLIVLLIFLLSQMCLYAQEKSIRFDKLSEYDNIRDITFCYGGKYICMARRDSVLNVCALDDGHVVMSTRNEEYCCEISFSSVIIYDTRTGNGWEHIADIEDAIFCKDCEYVVIYEYNDYYEITSSLYKSSTGECLGVLPFSDEISTLFVDKTIVLCHVNDALYLWNIVEASCEKVELNKSFSICEVMFKSNTNEMLLFNHDGSVYNLDIETLLLRKCDFSLDTGLVDVAYGESGYLATISENGLVKIWGEDYLTLLVEDTIPGQMKNLTFLSGGNEIKINMMDGSKYVLCVDGSKFYQASGYNTYIMKSADNDTKILLASYEAVYLIDFHKQFMVESGIYEYSVDEYVEGFSPCGTSFYTISESGEFSLFDIIASERFTLPWPYLSSVTAASYSPDGLRLIIALEEGDFLMWDLILGEITRLPMEMAKVHGISFSPDGRSIIVLSGNNAKIYDLVSMEFVSTSIYHDDIINSAFFSPDGRYVVTASQDYTVQIWDSERDFKQSDILFHEGPVYSAEFSEDGKYLSTLDFFGKCQIFRIRN